MAAFRQAAAEHGVGFHGPLTQSDGGQLAEIAKIVDAGKIRAIVNQVFELPYLPKAYDVSRIYRRDPPYF